MLLLLKLVKLVVPLDFQVCLELELVVLDLRKIVAGKLFFCSDDLIVKLLNKY